MQTAGDGVRLAVELSSGVQHGQRHLDAWLLQLRVQVHREASTVVRDPHPAVGEQNHLDGVAEAGQGLVHRVVHHLLHEVVQTTLTGGADVHARTLPDRLQALQDGQ